MGEAGPCTPVHPLTDNVLGRLRPGRQVLRALQLHGPIERWRAVRDEIHADICAHGFDQARNTFVQTYGGNALDAALLLIPQVGFLPTHDPRVAGTVAAIERELLRNGLVMRYSRESRCRLDGARRRGDIPGLLVLARRCVRDARPPR